MRVGGDGRERKRAMERESELLSLDFKFERVGKANSRLSAVQSESTWNNMLPSLSFIVSLMMFVIFYHAVKEIHYLYLWPL